MIYKIAIIFSIILLIIILRLVKENKLDEKYSILWIIGGIITLFVSIFPKSITKIAEVFGVYYPPSLMFLFGIIIVGILIIHLSVVITKQNKMIIRLNQEVRNT